MREPGFTHAWTAKVSIYSGMLQDELGVYFYNKGVVNRVKYLTGTESSSSNARH